MKRTLIPAVLMSLFLIPVFAVPAVDEELQLSPGQQFFFDTIHGRRSVRGFRDEPVPEAHLLKILDAARMAPTSGNQQPWKFLVVKDRQAREALKQACMEKGLSRIDNKAGLSLEQKKEQVKKLQNYYDNCFTAPLFVVVLVDMESKYPGYNHFDGPLAAANLILAARALGYGTVFYTDTISDDVTRKVLKIPERYQRVCITPIGVPLEWPETPPKKDLSEFIIYDAFQEK